MPQPRHIVIIGAGNAALSAALAASEVGARVTVLEKSNEQEYGGNSYFAAGLFRFPHHGVDDVCELLPHLGEESVSDLEVDPYPESSFYDDMGRVTQYRCDLELTELLVTNARAAMTWLSSYGVRFLWSRGRHAYNTDGMYKMWGGAALLVNGGGATLIDTLYEASLGLGVEILYGQRVTDILQSDQGRVRGVRVSSDEGSRDVTCDAVVMATGGFASNPEWRARYLGPNWDLAKVRGTKYNTGGGHQLAFTAGARSFGHWSGCHATAWDANAPAEGDRSLGDSFSRLSYPMGIMVNQNCVRFVDEGADFQTHTYAKYGAEILKQPGLFAYQIFDEKTVSLLRGDYHLKGASKVTADTIDGLARKLDIDPERLVETVAEYNAAVGDGEFNPNILDGKCTNGVSPKKSNWAQRLDSPPYYGYFVTTGVTFTFGGVRIDREGRVLDWANQPIRGLYAAGEIVGGLFYHNYPSGTGLTASTVFGRIAGTSAARPHE